MQNKSRFIFISEMQPTFERQLKGTNKRGKYQIYLRISERSTFDRQVKGSANRGKYKTKKHYVYLIIERMRAQKCATLLAFPRWERHIPSMGALCSHGGSVSFPARECDAPPLLSSRLLRSGLTLLSGDF